MPAGPSGSPTNGATAAIEVAEVVLNGLADEPVRARVTTSGSGRRLVFLHGLVGLNEHWEDVGGKLRDRLSCTMLELPLLTLRGDHCSIQGVAALTADFLDRFIDGPSVLVGNSFGGHVALRIAIERPDLVEALVLAGSSGLIEKTIVRGAPTRPSREWLEEKIGELFHDKSKMRQADLDRAHRELSERGGARAMVRLSKSARRNHLGERIGAISCPTQLIWGREDIVTPPNAALEFKKLIPDARLLWLDQCGHAPMLEQPEAFADALIDFIDELDARDRDAD